MTNEYKHFTSSQAFAAWIQERQAANASTTGSRYGYGYGRDISTGLRQLEQGDETNVERARALLTEFQENIEVLHYQWERDVAGAFPDVPSYIMGVPESMWTQQPILSDRSPLRIWVGLTSSGGIGEETLVKRGITLAAFAMAISAKRPVLISPYVNLGNDYRRDYYARTRSGSYSYAQNALLSWDISTSPLVLSELMACLSSPNITRRLGLVVCYMLNPGVTGNWHSDYDNESAMREHLGAKPEDLYLPSIHLYDPILSDPIAWLKTNVAKYSQEEY